MAVARDDLRRQRVRLEPETLARESFDFRLDLGVRPDGSRKLTDAIRLECAHHPRTRAVELERPPGELPAEGGRLRVNAVRPSDAYRVSVLLGTCHDRVECAVDALHDQPARVADLQ